MGIRSIGWALMPLSCLFALQLTAQSEQLRKADKQYDYHAYSSALAGYKALDRRNPGSGWIEGRMGACLVRLSQPKEALPYLEAASARKNPPPDLWRFLGHAYRSLERYPQARLAYQKSVYLDSAWAAHHIRLCDWALEAGFTQDDAWQVREVNAWNSSASDFGIAPIGTGLGFSSFRSSIPSPPPGWVSGQTMHYPYQVNAKDGSIPELMKRELGYVPNEGPCAEDSHSGRVVFMRANFHGNQQLTPESGFAASLFVATMDERGNWAQVRPFEHNGTGFSNAWPSFSADGKRLYFSSDRKGGLGGYDLYVSHWNGKAWGEPVHLGPRVNTAGNEITPRELDGNLLFASDWHPGFGGFDLFIAYRSESEYIAVSNLGKPLNSSLDDLGAYLVRPGEGYFISNRKGLGDLDIYRCQRTREVLQVAVRDAISGDLLPAVEASWGEATLTKTKSSWDGILSIPVSERMSDKILLTKQGYLKQQVDLRLAKGKEGIQVISLWPSAWEFKPSVKDALSGNPLPTATMVLTEKKTGFSQRLSADPQGRITVRLRPRTLYTAQVACPGFHQKELEFATGQSPIDPFGQVALRAIGQADGSKSLGKDALVYAIQLGAVRRSKPVDLGPFLKAEEYGVLFVDSDSIMSRIRLGYFPSRMEADSVSRLLAGKGFRDRVLVLVEQGRPAAKESLDGNRTVQGPYRIRLAALRDPSKFVATPWEAYGQVIRERVGDLTVIAVSGLLDLELARQVREKARQSGFPDARIQVEAAEGWRFVD